MLAWLLGEPAGADVRSILATADIVIASDLTLIECDRALIRLATLEPALEGKAAESRAHLVEMSSHWDLLRMSGEIVDRARQPFPGEPVRSLDAIHLASLLVARASVSGLEMLSLDDRIRSTTRAVGVPLQPA